MLLNPKSHSEQAGESPYFGLLFVFLASDALYVRVYWN